VGQRVDRETNIGSILLMMVALSIAGDAVRAQSPVTSTTPTATSSAPAASPTFDVASIKPSKPGVSGSNSDFNKETYTASNVTLKSIIQYDAYEIAGPQILGIPPVLDSVTFDIQAKIDPAVYEKMKTLSRDQFHQQFEQMIRQLLADRFKLAVHPETRQLPVYALVVAQNGPKLQPAKDPDAGTSLSSRRGQLTAKGVSSAQLAEKFTRSLSDELGRIVIDKTGLTGRYDLTLKWTPDIGPAPLLNGEPDTSAPSIFTAIQEQLGLKFESTKGPVPVLVVDHAELPSEN
jgi:uncharacterized protein (TIGR03435 family)